VLLAFDVGYFLLWAAMINESFVQQAGREYAEALFRTLEAPSNPPHAQGVSQEADLTSLRVPTKPGKVMR